MMIMVMMIMIKTTRFDSTVRCDDHDDDDHHHDYGDYDDFLPENFNQVSSFDPTVRESRGAA